LFLLTALESLDMNLNQFSGSISSSIGLLTNLKVLQIDSNGFVGTIPPEIMQLGSLSESIAARIYFFLAKLA
jgi:Leucine-rich repeat (LRR) protein